MNISDSEFYYPGELTDEELLQQPTYSEREEKKSNLLTDEEVQNFIKSQQQANTVKKTTYDMNVTGFRDFSVTSARGGSLRKYFRLSSTVFYLISTLQ